MNSARPSFASSLIAGAPPAIAAPSSLQRERRTAKYGPGASDTEIKLGQTMPYSGPASAYGTIGKVEQAYFKMINDAGRHQRPQDQPDQPRRRLQPAEDGRAGAQAGRAGRGAGAVPDARHAEQLGDPQVRQRQEGAASASLATGATKWGDPKNFPWTIGFNLSYQTEGADLRQVPAEEQAQRQDRDPLPERRLRQGRAEGRQGRARATRPRR